MICDLAQTYHILDYKGLSPNLVATLILGLEDSSRVKRHLSGQRLSLEQMLMAIMVDDLNFLCWSKTKDAQHKRHKPKSVFKMLNGDDKKAKDELQVFDDPEAFEEYMKRKREEWDNA